MIATTNVFIYDLWSLSLNDWIVYSEKPHKINGDEHHRHEIN